MAELTGLQKAAIKRSLETAEYLSEGIAEGGNCELEGSAYDFASLKLIEIQHWLREVLKDNEASLTKCS